MMVLIFFYLAAVDAYMNYSDYVARNVSLPLSAALYSPNATSCLQKRLNSSAVKI